MHHVTQLPWSKIILFVSIYSLCHIPFSETLILRNPHSPEPLFSGTTILRNPHSPKLPFSKISISLELPFSYFSEFPISPKTPILRNSHFPISPKPLFFYSPKFLFLRIPYFSENTY